MVNFIGPANRFWGTIVEAYKESQRRGNEDGAPLTDQGTKWLLQMLRSMTFARDDFTDAAKVTEGSSQKLSQDLLATVNQLQNKIGKALNQKPERISTEIVKDSKELAEKTASYEAVINQIDNAELRKNLTWDMTFFREALPKNLDRLHDTGKPWIERVRKRLHRQKT